MSTTLPTEGGGLDGLVGGEEVDTSDTNFTQILLSLCLVDVHTLTLQLLIQTPHSVVPELQVFVSSLETSAKRAHTEYCSCS